MPFGVVLAGLLGIQAASAVVYWSGGAEPRRAAAPLRIAGAAVGIGLIALVAIAWDGLAVQAEPCSHFGRASDLRGSEEYVLGSCLVAAGSSLIVSLAAPCSRRAVAGLVGLALAATVIAALYFASHVSGARCWGP